MLVCVWYTERTCIPYCFFVFYWFGLMLNVPVKNIQSCLDGATASWVLPVVVFFCCFFFLGGGGKYVLLKDTTRLQPPTSGSGVRGVNHQATAPHIPYWASTTSSTDIVGQVLGPCVCGGGGGGLCRCAYSSVRIQIRSELYAYPASANSSDKSCMGIRPPHTAPGSCMRRYGAYDIFRVFEG